jgi:hypothetical protein
VTCTVDARTHWATRNGRPAGTTTVLIDTLRSLTLPQARGQARGGADALALGDSTLARIDPATGRGAQRLHTGGDPVAVAADGHHVWVAVNSDRALLQLTP